MDVNTSHDSEESKLGFIIADTHAMQIVVVQHMVIDSFCRCSVLVDLLHLSDLYTRGPAFLASSPSATYTVRPYEEVLQESWNGHDVILPIANGHLNFFLHLPWS